MPEEPISMADALAEDTPVTVDADSPDADGDFEVVIEGESPQSRPALNKEALDAAEASGADDDKDLSERARKRISTLTYHVRERERQIEEERKVGEALSQYGTSAKAIIERLSRDNVELQKSVREQALLAREAQLAATHNEYRVAREEANTEKELAAAQKLAEITQQRAMLAQYQVPEPWQPPAVPVRQQQESMVDPVTAKWLTENRWFSEDKNMRTYAASYSEQLSQQGVAPQTETFYSYIDAEMRKRFPERFEAGTPMSATAKPEHSAKTNSRPPVATAARTNGTANGKRTIVMSAGDAEMYKRAAAKLGVDFKDFVKNIPREQL